MRLELHLKEFSAQGKKVAGAAVIESCEACGHKWAGSSNEKATYVVIGVAGALPGK